MSAAPWSSAFAATQCWHSRFARRFSLSNRSPHFKHVSVHFFVADRAASSRARRLAAATKGLTSSAANPRFLETCSTLSPQATQASITGNHFGSNFFFFAITLFFRQAIARGDVVDDRRHLVQHFLKLVERENVQRMQCGGNSRIRRRQTTFFRFFGSDRDNLAVIFVAHFSFLTVMRSREPGSRQDALSLRMADWMLCNSEPRSVPTFLIAAI